MVQVPTKEDIDAILVRLNVLERENKFLREFLTDLQWLSVSQVAKAMSCSVDTVYRLIKMDRIVYRYEGKKVMCSMSSVRSYLTGKKLDEIDVQYRLMRACQSE
jgi:excisionase family DNA binding protein